MINKIFNFIVIILSILIISLLVVDSMIENVKLDEDINEEKMIAIANDVKRLEAREEEIKSEDEVALEVSNNESISYEGKSIEEIAEQLDRNFNNELKGKGYLYSSYSISKGVDPYLAAAISLEETGCKWNCSSLVKNCHNVGGMKGSGCGEYGYFEDLDTGIRAFIDNIYKNYILYGLTTADTMNPKYAENPLWGRNVNAYINRIKNN